jgi:hypothetical protein
MLLDISLVSQTLVSLIDKHVKASPEAGKVAPLLVTSEPADKLTGDHAIGIYMYHIAEDPHYKNLPSPSDEEPPVRYTPMGLNLFYQLTARSGLNGETATQKEQIMMGLAMKALHDYPVIDDSTRIGLVQVFPAALQGTENRFRIVLQPVLANEAVNYWASGSRPMRLSAYYQVSVVLLEPEKTKSHTGRVLTYGVYSFVRGSPRLDGSKSTIAFLIPGEASPREVEVKPAEAPIGGKLIFFGSDLSGDETTLLLKNTRFAAPIEVGTEWGVSATESQIFAVVQPKAGLTTILPGIYSAIAKVTTRRMMPDKKLRAFSQTSNESPFVVTPRIDGISAPTPAGIVTVNGAVFKDIDLPVNAVELFLGAKAIALKGVGPLNPDQFEVVDETTLRFRFPIAGLNSGDVVPLRLIINGAESAPNWVTVP